MIDLESFRYWAKRELIGEPMGTDMPTGSVLETADAEGTIAIRVTIRPPNPAWPQVRRMDWNGATLVDLFPEPFGNRPTRAWRATERVSVEEIALVMPDAPTLSVFWLPTDTTDRPHNLIVPRL